MFKFKHRHEGLCHKKGQGHKIPLNYQYVFFLEDWCNERKSKQAHMSHAPPLLDNVTHNEWQGMQ